MFLNSLTGAVLAQNDAVCQRALTQVILAWEPFEDTETKVTRCFVKNRC